VPVQKEEEDVADSTICCFPPHASFNLLGLFSLSWESEAVVKKKNPF